MFTLSFTLPSSLPDNMVPKDLYKAACSLGTVPQPCLQSPRLCRPYRHSCPCAHHRSDSAAQAWPQARV